MAAKSAILITLKRLEQARQTNTPIIVETKQRSVNQLIVTLLEKKKVRQIKEYKNSCLLKVLNEVEKIEGLPKTVQVKKVDILDWSTKLLNGEEGHLLLTTTKGVITHQDALKYRIGGEILGFVQ